MKKKKLFLLGGLFFTMYLLGIGAAIAKERICSSYFLANLQKNLACMTNKVYSKEWGLGFSDDNQTPTGTLSKAELLEEQAFYVGDETNKKVYLTFDCGYENGNTKPILDTLNKHQAKATFFVVGHFLETAQHLIQEMVKEGHTIGNHTYHHKGFEVLEDKEAFEEELKLVESKYQELTGESMTKFYRPPQGKCSKTNLQLAKELGYDTFFWSLAYKDWDVNDQPSKEEAISILTKRVHPGAVILLHNTSKTNAEMLDDFLTELEKMGYEFGTLEEIVQQTSNS